MERKNAGYTITDSLRIGNTEFVIGENHTHHGIMYVTWQCLGKDNYFWGHYLDNRQAAERDLLDRARLEFDRSRHMSPPPHRTKEYER